MQLEWKENTVKGKDRKVSMEGIYRDVLEDREVLLIRIRKGRIFEIRAQFA